jgi:hypothetical protein
MRFPGRPGNAATGQRQQRVKNGGGSVHNA